MVLKLPKLKAIFCASVLSLGGCSFERGPQATEEVIAEAISDGKITAKEAGDMIFNPSRTLDSTDQKTVEAIRSYLDILIGDNAIAVNKENTDPAIKKVEGYVFQASAFYYLERMLIHEESKPLELLASISQALSHDPVNHVEQPHQFQEIPEEKVSEGEKRAAEKLLGRIHIEATPHNIEHAVLASRKIALIIEVNSIHQDKRSTPEAIPDMYRPETLQINV
jgi:hypothetical protein